MINLEHVILPSRNFPMILVYCRCLLFRGCDLSKSAAFSVPVWTFSRPDVFFDELTLLLLGYASMKSDSSPLQCGRQHLAAENQVLQTQCLEASALALTWKLPSWGKIFMIPAVHAILPRIKITNNRICDSYKWEKVAVCLNKLKGKIAVHVPWRWTVALSLHLKPTWH